MTVIAGFYAQRRARMLAQLTTDLFVAAWVVLCCRALRAGAQEAVSIAESLPPR